MTKKNGAKAVFDFADISYAWQRRWMALHDQIRVLGKDNADDPEGITTQLLEFIDQRDEMLLRAIKEVPREYLVNNAPDEIDWTDKTALDYLRYGMMEQLAADFNEAASLIMGRAKN